MIRSAVILCVLVALSACETTKGAGRDLQKAGQAITGAAQDVQDTL